MTEIFFIADLHLGHKGIIKFTKTAPFRQFETIEEHDQEIIRRWNSVVYRKDRVYLLGDAVFGRRNLPLLGQLNGIKTLIGGNHDLYGADEYEKYFHSIYGCLEYKGSILTHIPVHPQQLRRYFMNVHGHLHTDKIDDPRYFNVSAEQINLTPIPWDEIINQWAMSN